MGVSRGRQGTFVWNFPGDIALHDARLSVVSLYTYRHIASFGLPSTVKVTW